VTCEVEISPASSSSIFTLQRFGGISFSFVFPHNKNYLRFRFQFAATLPHTSRQKSNL
jgi:hypothetical protein